MEIDDINSEIEALKAAALGERDSIEPEPELEPELEESEVVEVEPEVIPVVEAAEIETTEVVPEKEEVGVFTPVEFQLSSGRMITVDSLEELTALAKQGVAPVDNYSEVEDFIKQADFEQTDLQLLADAKKGSKEAISALAEKFGIDVLDLNANEGYQPEFKMEQRSEIDTFAEQILQNSELATEYRRVIKGVDESFMEFIHGNVDHLRVFSEHVKNGTAEKAIDGAYKIAAMERIPFHEAYEKAHSRLSPATESPAVEPQARQISDEEKKMRELAGLGGSTPKNTGKETKDVWKMSDEEFEEHKQSLQTNAQ